MIQIAIIVLSSLAILVAALLNYAPNLQQVVDSDFMRRSHEYAYIRSLEEAQLKNRAGSLPADPAALSDPGCLFQDGKDASTCLKLWGRAEVLSSGNISVVVDEGMYSITTAEEPVEEPEEGTGTEP